MIKGFPNKKQSLKKGFTLIELVVALALFGFISVASVGAMLSVLSGNQKAQSLISAMDSLNFAMDSMTRELRVGDTYNCTAPTVGNTGDCLPGDNIMGFNSSDDDFIVYRLNVATNRIERCGRSSVGGVPGFDCVGAYDEMTGPNVVIDELTFYVTGTAVGDLEQPRVTIVVGGTAGRTSSASSFRIQTTITQRFPDF